MSDEQAQIQEDQPAIEQPDSDTAADTGENQETKVTFSPEQQELVNKIAGSKHIELREAKLKADDLQKRLEDLQSKQPVETRPEIPTVDQFADDYDEKIKLRDQAIASAATFDANQVTAQAVKQQAAQEQHDKQQQQLANDVQGYIDRSKKLNVDKQKLEDAGKHIREFGIGIDIQNHLLRDDHGPLLTTYLSDNPQDMLSLSQMSPMQAAVMIETQIKPKAIAAGKDNTLTPDPPDILNGRGVPPKTLGPAGATFE